MKSSVRGMAKVSVIWSIVFLVLAIVGGMAFFLASGEMDNQKNRAELLSKALEEEKAKVTRAAEEKVAVSEVMGFVDPTKGNNTDLDTLKKGLEDLKKSFDLPASTKTYSDALPLLSSALNDRQARIADLDGQIRAKMTEVDELLKARREADSAAQSQIADLTRQVNDAQQQVEDTKSEYERQVAELRDQVRTKNSEVASVQEQQLRAAREFAQEAEALRNRMSEMGRKLQPFVKEPEAADGQILSVSKVLAAGWIDIGAAQRLPVGTRFEVKSAADGRLKATAEVTQVERDMAEVRFIAQSDPFDPPSPGDLVSNPLYDPRGHRYALLVGGFSGEYGETKLKGLLASMGITVQTKLDNATDFLIVGNEQYVDQDGQPVETPIQPADLPAYKEAVGQGVQVVLLKDLRNYFRF